MRRPCDSKCSFATKPNANAFGTLFLHRKRRARASYLLSSDNVLSPRSVRRCNASELWLDELISPAAMTICALLLRHRFYSLKPSERLKYATLGLLFVNISVGGVLTQFGSPQVVIAASASRNDLSSSMIRIRALEVGCKLWLDCNIGPPGW